MVMGTSVRMRVMAIASVCAVSGVVLSSPPATAAPGDWTNVSSVAGGGGYPEISTSALPSIEIFGNDVQVAWSQSDGTTTRGLYTAILDKGGKVRVPKTVVVTETGSLSNYPQLVGYQGQRAVSFGGANGVQALATSPDGISWTRNPGSLSATNLASTSSGGGTVNSAGDTLIWAGAPNLGSFTWHVGLASTNPAPAGSDQVFQPPQSGTSGVNVAYQASTNATYGAFYQRGTYVAQIHPTFSGFTLGPGSAADGTAREAGSIVPLAARAQGGIYVGYAEPQRGGALQVREITSGTVLNVPGSADAEGMSLSAASNGRLWLTFEKGSQMYVAQTDPGAKAFSRPVPWGNPERGATIYGSIIKGDNSGAYVAVNVYAGRAQNIWTTVVEPNLTVDVLGKARPGATVKVRVRDGGAPVRNARVVVNGKTYKTKAGGTVSFKAPRASSVKVVAKGSGYRDGVSTISLGR